MYILIIIILMNYSKAGLGSYTFTEDLVQAMQRFLDDHKYTGPDAGIRVLEMNSGLHTSPFELLPHLSIIKRCFTKDTVPQIMKALEKESKTSDWAAKQLEKLKKKSPLSLVITLEAFHRAKESSINQVLLQDFRLTTRFLVNNIFLISHIFSKKKEIITLLLYNFFTFCRIVKIFKKVFKK